MIDLNNKKHLIEASFILKRDLNSRKILYFFYSLARNRIQPLCHSFSFPLFRSFSLFFFLIILFIPKKAPSFYYCYSLFPTYLLFFPLYPYVLFYDLTIMVFFFFLYPFLILSFLLLLLISFPFYFYSFCFLLFFLLFFSHSYPFFLLFPFFLLYLFLHLLFILPFLLS